MKGRPFDIKMNGDGDVRRLGECVYIKRPLLEGGAPVVMEVQGGWFSSCDGTGGLLFSIKSCPISNHIMSLSRISTSGRT